MKEAERRGHKGSTFVSIREKTGRFDGNLEELRDEAHTIRASDIELALLHWQTPGIALVIDVHATQFDVSIRVESTDGVLADAVFLVASRVLQRGAGVEHEYKSDIHLLDEDEVARPPAQVESRESATSREPATSRASDSGLPNRRASAAEPIPPSNLWRRIEAKATLINVGIGIVSVLVAVGAIVVAILLAH
jgi:hypothetical protein